MWIGLIVLAIGVVLAIAVFFQKARVPEDEMGDLFGGIFFGLIAVMGAIVFAISLAVHLWM